MTFSVDAKPIFLLEKFADKNEEKLHFDKDLFAETFGTAVLQPVVAEFLGVLVLRNPAAHFEEGDVVARKLHKAFDANLKGYVVKA